ncbi:BON domain-containing protein [Hydrogenophaga sp. PAMC20947]|uniref:BON domain-containing protein n=1 Tax=Hydrogenophaga sp. PAMC20947 TaxID=2565558 RepID=UPI00109DB11A|nr:BON domain-containing protein [Hydrogenophaga sp. PAMC20947]QCB47192.1 BON domain-containing protein [Hydrogenophaga sp. PAMC20947]
MTSIDRFARWTRLVLGTAALGAVLSACAPLMVGGALTGAMVATDRRTSGAQLDDQGIELRAANRLGDTFGGRARINVTSYNRRVLLTGEVANERDRQLAADTVKAIDNVNMVYNELGITNSPTFTEKAADTLLTGRVKAGLVDTKKLSANSFKVVSERATVYLMGRVTQREADQATDVARTTKGAQRVVRVFEILSEEELARMAIK